MKGVMFNLLEAFVSEAFGDDAYEQILAACPLHARGPHVGPATYPDADLMAIAGAACAQLGVSLDAALHAFGTFAAPRLAARVPVFLEGHLHPRSFLSTIDDIIHVEVRKLDPDAQPPRIVCTDGETPDELYLSYASRRQLCPLLLGLIEGTGAIFGVPITATHLRCMRTGAEACELHLAFGAAARREHAA
jgi:hypothetical protein